MASESTTYDLNVGSQATDDALPGLIIVLHMVTQTDQGLLMRVGIFNPTDKPVSSTQVITAKQITLTADANGKRQQVTPTTTTLAELCPGGVLGPQAMHNGLLTFALDRDEAALDTLGTMQLQVEHFAPVLFALDKTRMVTPVNFAATEKRSPLNLDVTPSVEQIAIFTMRLHSLLIKDDALEMALSFHNNSRFAVTWKGKLNGTLSRLISQHSDMLRPTEVSPSLKDQIAPPRATWAAGEDNTGWVRFPLPPVQAAGELAFAFPGYPPIRLLYDHERRVWQPVAQAKATAEPLTKVEVVLDEERTFAELKAFWADATHELSQHQFPSFLRRFRGDALLNQRASITNWSTIPIDSISMALPAFQSVKPDETGRLRKVRVEMQYTLATLPLDNQFISQMECDMRRGHDGEWLVEDIHYPQGQPFWLLGYTGVATSEHFMVFHRPAPKPGRAVGLALSQLESSYRNLTRTGLPLKPNYAAFLVGEKEDFQKLTQHNPDNYSGVTTAAYRNRDGAIRVINQAIYLNDYRFFTLQRAWGQQDRQATIQHELVHLALADFTRPWTPPWLAEGLAMHYAKQTNSITRRALRSQLDEHVSLPLLSRMTHLGNGSDDPLRLMTEYQLSGETVKWLIKTYGEATVLRLYAAYGSAVPPNLAAYSGTTKAAAETRLKFTRKIFSEKMEGLSLEQMDALVRAVVMD